MNHTKYWDELEKTFNEQMSYMGSEYVPGLRIAINGVCSAKSRMNKEYKQERKIVYGIRWAFAFFLIQLGYKLVEGTKENSYQTLDIFLYGFFILATLSVLEFVYKLFKTQSSKEQDTHNT